MGVSPYFAVTGMHPILPFDIVEATYLMPQPTHLISTTELIANWAVALQQRSTQLVKLRGSVFDTRVRATRIYEREHTKTMQSFNFVCSTLVLMCNMAIEKALNRKMCARYIGPLVVVARNREGTYIVCKLDSAVYNRPVAVFWLIPYLACKDVIRFDLGKLDVTLEHLREMRATTESFDMEWLDEGEEGTGQSESEDEDSEE